MQLFFFYNLSTPPPNEIKVDLPTDKLQCRLFLYTEFIKNGRRAGEPGVEHENEAF